MKSDKYDEAIANVQGPNNNMRQVGIINPSQSAVVKVKAKKKNELDTGEICMGCIVCCCNLFCCKCGNKDKTFKGYRCMAKLCAYLCKKLCGKKSVFSENDKQITVKGVFEYCTVGDLVFISTLIPFDSTCKVLY